MAMLIGMLLAAFLATSVIPEGDRRKTVLTVVSKTVPRPSVVLGKVPRGRDGNRHPRW